MPATPATTVRARVKTKGGSFAASVGACRDALVRHFLRRSALASLRELDDRALRDIGIVRSQIEAAVDGFVARPDRGRM